MRTPINTEAALQKIKHFCGYRERCHAETKEKLYSYRLYSTEVDRILAYLIEENFLNEERFATNFSVGHFRIKKWGKLKIQYHLKQKKVNTHIIQIALKAIDQLEYTNTLSELIAQQWVRHEKNSFLTRYAKTTQFLQQRGFEPILIRKILETYK